MSKKDDEQAFDKVWQRLCRRIDRVGFAGLSDSEKSVFAISMLISEVDNGGFSQWMFNTYGDHAEAAVAALHELGARDSARVCERFFALLPGGRPRATQNARERQLWAAAKTRGEGAFDRAVSRLEKRFYASKRDLRRRLYKLARSLTP